MYFVKWISILSLFYTHNNSIDHTFEVHYFPSISFLYLNFIFMEEVQWNQYAEEAPASLLFKLIQQIVNHFQEGEISMLDHMIFKFIDWDAYLQDRSKFRHFLQQVVDLMVNDVIPSDQFCDYVQFIFYAVLV